MTTQQLEQLAIQSALENNWNKAIEYNEQILNTDPNNLDALLRLGFAAFQANDLNKAKSAYKKILELRPHNPIAKEKLKQINILIKEKKSISSNNLKLDPNMFTDVPGKTKTIKLINLGQKNVLAKLNTGEKLNINIRKRRVELRNNEDEYVGALPDDLSKRLILFLNADSVYEVYIKEANLKDVTVFIKEISKGKKIERFISFPEDLHKNIDSLERISTRNTTDNNDDNAMEDNDEDDEEFDEAETPDEIDEMVEELESYEENEDLSSTLSLKSDLDSDDDDE
ncbi:MAG: hypothetical protein KatS3mg091_368 [Patescibacteria group bacterium]|nr:MAG: hypothetical protein KatS3mg091_368 [Patescibacteria group bacterium]